MILVAEVIAIVLVLMVNVIAVASTAATLPCMGRTACFFGTAAAGALVSSPARLGIGVAINAAATKAKQVIFVRLIFILC